MSIREQRKDAPRTVCHAPDPGPELTPDHWARRRRAPASSNESSATSKRGLGRSDWSSGSAWGLGLGLGLGRNRQTRPVKERQRRRSERSHVYLINLEEPAYHEMLDGQKGLIKFELGGQVSELRSKSSTIPVIGGERRGGAYGKMPGSAFLEHQGPSPPLAEPRVPGRRLGYRRRRLRIASRRPLATEARPRGQRLPSRTRQLTGRRVAGTPCDANLGKVHLSAGQDPGPARPRQAPPGAVCTPDPPATAAARPFYVRVTCVDARRAVRGGQCLSGTNAAPSLGDRQASEDRPHPRGTSTTSPLANPARSGVGSPWAAGAVAHEDAIDRGDTFAAALLRLKSGSRRATAPRPTKLPKLTPGHPSSQTWCTWRGGWVAYAIKAMSGRVLNRRAKRQRPKLHAIERPRRLHHQHGGPVAGHCGITRLQHPARSACLLVRPWNSDSLQTTLVKRGAGLRKFRRPAVNECCTPDLAMQRARKPRRVQGSETRRGKIEFETCLCRARVQRPQVFRYPSCPGPPCGCPHAIQAPRHEPKGKKFQTDVGGKHQEQPRGNRYEKVMQ